MEGEKIYCKHCEGWFGKDHFYTVTKKREGKIITFHYCKAWRKLKSSERKQRRGKPKIIKEACRWCKSFSRIDGKKGWCMRRKITTGVKDICGLFKWPMEGLFEIEAGK